MSIRNLRKSLHDSIKKYGISSKQTYEISTELDREIAKYYKNSSMKIWYQKSYEGFCKYQNGLGKLPDETEWNQYAKEKDYLSSESMKYIGNIKFRREG